MSDNRVIQSMDSCMDDYDNSLPIARAREQILAHINPINDYQCVALRDSLGRVLAEDIQSPLDVPNHMNSAMDGYAVRGADLPDDSIKTFQVTGIALAGQRFQGDCPQDGAIRIMTGAAMPAGTDTVVMQERVEVIDDAQIRIGSGHRAGQHTRQAGEDIAKGALVATSGQRISAADLGVMASLGIGEVRIRRRPRVAFLSTGDELRSIGEQLDAGEVYDSNRYSLFSMLKELDVEIHDLGVVRDDPDALREAFHSAMALGDVVITSGGVSVGEADHIKGIVGELGNIDFWKIAMKPGRPLAFGSLHSEPGHKLFFGLPGNPVAVMVTFQQFVTPALHYLASGQVYKPLTVQAVAQCALRKMPGRYEFQRGILSYQDDGSPQVDITGHQGSGILTSMSRANCFILLDEAQGPVNAGDMVTVQPFTHTSLRGIR